jgi:hypothetical protein
MTAAKTHVVIVWKCVELNVQNQLGPLFCAKDCLENLEGSVIENFSYCEKRLYLMRTAMTQMLYSCIKIVLFAKLIIITCVSVPLNYTDP